jgi:hypothetical protein
MYLFFMPPAFAHVVRQSGLPEPKIADVYGRALVLLAGSCVFTETLLTSMKFIIALLDQEVKRYVVISLIILCKYLILMVNI